MKRILFLLVALSFTISAQITQQWLAAYNGPSGSIDSVRNLVVDNAGNIYITGSSTSSNLLDYTTLKYNSNGALLWEARYDGPSHFRDDAQWITIDNFGNIYVTGSSRSGVQAGTEDMLTVKYNTNGVQQWAARYQGPSGSTDVAIKAAVDNSGNVLVTGWSYENGALVDFATIKYNSDGVQQWVARYNGPGSSIDAPSALAVDNSGNVYVTGWSRSTTLSGSEDYVTIKYNSSGAQQWVARHDGPANWTDAATSIALDNFGNVVVTGHSYATATLSDYVTIKYNSSGTQQWLATYDNNGFSGSDLAKMVVIDNSGNIYVTGSSGTVYPLGYPNYVTVKYSPSGQQQWTASYNGPGNANDEPYAIALDGSGNVYVTGKATIPGFMYDFATVKYSSTGNLLWESRFNGPTNMHDGATWVAIDNAGNLYLTGNSMYYNNYASDFVTIKYSQQSKVNMTGLSKISSEIPETFILKQNYPNPFNPSTNIEFGLPERSNVRLKICDLTGREIRILADEILEPGNYKINFDAAELASGSYIYSIIADGFIQSKIMIVLK